MAGRMRRITQDDSGFAMLVVVGVMSVVTILAVSSFVLARHALHESERVEDSSRAFRVASSALEGQIPRLNEQSLADLLPADPSNPYADAVYGETDEGEYYLWAIDLGRSEFELVAEGRGLDGSVETIRQRFFYLDLWKLNISAGDGDTDIGGANTLQGSSFIVGPFYVRGSLSIDANMSVFEGPLFVKTRDGGITRSSAASYLGHPDEYIDVYCDSLIIPENEYRANGGVYVGTRSASVPDILLPPLEKSHLEKWATTARQESVDNKIGPAPESGADGRTPNKEAEEGDPATYTTMQPPNTETFSRVKAAADGDESYHYKFFGPADGSVSDLGQGDTHLTIGESSFGAWGRITDVDGNVVTAAHGPEGIDSYPDGSHDDFAYKKYEGNEKVDGLLFISGTVFVDGPVTLEGDTVYVGNGTIVANGDITVNGALRPLGNIKQGVDNGWALGLVTPGDIRFTDHDRSAIGSVGPDIREKLEKPAYSGAFYAAGAAHFPKNQSSFFGTMLTGEMNFNNNNNVIVTNPWLPSYLPDSLPGGDMSFVLPTHWSRD